MEEKLICSDQDFSRKPPNGWRLRRHWPRSLTKAEGVNHRARKLDSRMIRRI